MRQDDLNKLYSLLDEIKKIAPCKGNGCVGYQHCEFGENGCYGESCAIDDVTNAISYYAPEILGSDFGSSGR